MLYGRITAFFAKNPLYIRITHPKIVLYNSITYSYIGVVQKIHRDNRSNHNQDSPTVVAHQSSHNNESKTIKQIDC